MCVPSVVVLDQINGGLLKDISRNVLQLDLMWLADIKPGEPHWRKSDPLLKNHTRAAETEATYTLPGWPDPPNDEEATHRGQIFKCI